MNDLETQLNALDLDAFEDFESEDLDENYSDQNDDYLDSMWSGYGFGRNSFGDQKRNADAVVVAHGMVQSFVNAFAREGSYVVRFADAVKTAGTNVAERVVVITSAPILDETLTAREAGLILTGLAVHEISHARYGLGTSGAARAAFPRSRVAHILSNLLDDVRIERRFVRDYPGYAGVFEPLLKYISGGPKPTVKDQLNLAIAAVRFSKYNDWSDPLAARERDWWRQWSARYSREDSPRRHVDGIRAALRHMIDVREELRAQEARDVTPEPEQSGSAPETDDEPTDDAPDIPEDAQDGPGADKDDEDDDDAPSDAPAPEGAPDEPPEDAEFNQPGANLDEELGDSEESDEAEGEGGEASDGLSDLDLGKAADELDGESPDEDLDSCPSEGDAVEDAARDNGVAQTSIDKLENEADQMVKDATEVQDGVDVAMSPNGMKRGNYSTRVRRNGMASRFIRDALMRARVGHTKTSTHQKRGRLDSKGLTRVAHQDFRVFQRRNAPGPDKLLIWVMIDCSGSMQAASADAATVTTAIADAAQHVRTTRMAVWGWSDRFRRSDWMPSVCRVWQTGQPITDIAKVADLNQSGTPDSAILNWAWRAILRECHGGERPVILFASDGGGYGDLQMKVAEAREHGVSVYSVAIGEDVDVSYQTQVYGEGNFVEWQGSIIKTARPLAKLVARMVMGRRA